jgi:hypothetical protein
LSRGSFADEGFMPPEAPDLNATLRVSDVLQGNRAQFIFWSICADIENQICGIPSIPKEKSAKSGLNIKKIIHANAAGPASGHGQIRESVENPSWAGNRCPVFECHRLGQRCDQKLFRISADRRRIR